MGWNNAGQLGNGSTSDSLVPIKIVESNVRAIALGHTHSLFLKTDGSLWGMGQNGSGQLGDGTQTNRLNPVQVINSDGTAFSDIMRISAGDSHSVYLKSDGTVWASGDNFNGQLGDGTTSQRINPVQVLKDDGTSLTGVTSVSAHNFHTIYHLVDGTIYAAGKNGFGMRDS